MAYIVSVHLLSHIRFDCFTRGRDNQASSRRRGRGVDDVTTAWVDFEECRS